MLENKIFDSEINHSHFKRILFLLYSCIINSEGKKITQNEWRSLSTCKGIEPTRDYDLLINLKMKTKKEKKITQNKS